MVGSTWYNAERVKQPGSVVLANALPGLRDVNQRRRAAMRAPQAADRPNGSMSLSEFNDWLKGLHAGPGVLDADSAMRISAVYACVSLIGGAIASLPLKFYRERGTDREEYKPDEWWLLNEQPLACWSAAAAWEYATASLLLQGDSFWRIHRASRLSPRIVGFEPLHPQTVEVRRDRDRLIYRVSPQPSQLLNSEGTVILDQDDILHVSSPGFDGLRGLSQIQYALAGPGGVALMADEFAAAFFRNGSRPDFALQTDLALNKEQIDNLRDQVAERHNGARNAFKPIVLQGGLKVQPITMTAEDSQLIDQRRFQIEDIARVFGVPPHMIGHTQNTTSWGSGVEQMSIGFVKYTLQRHLVKFEQEINRKVFRTAGRFSEFSTAGLERGDIKTRYDAYRVALGRAGEPGWMKPSEIRRMENLPADDSFDKALNAVRAPAADPTPAPAPAEEQE